MLDKDNVAHPVSEENSAPKTSENELLATETFGGRIHVEWDPTAAVTPIGQLPFFIQFLKVGGLFEPWVSDCPLRYVSDP